MVLSGARTGSVRFGLGTLGVVVALAAVSGPSVAQVGDKPAAAGDAAGKIEKGRQLFSDFGCASCHTLTDAGATGHVGPSLDGDPNLTPEFVVGRVTNGQGMMPAFAGQLSPEEVAAVAAYVIQVAAK
jgi:mono/diheme cytochrome c family protein